MTKIDGETALGQQGVRSDFFTGDIDGVKQGDGYFDFICAFFFFIAFNGKIIEFFGV
ncbi:hypothetical protein K8T06_09665 [bacterium]|nr:hypothetical protein [bacterium]